MADQLHYLYKGVEGIECVWKSYLERSQNYPEAHGSWFSLAIAWLQHCVSLENKNTTT